MAKKNKKSAPKRRKNLSSETYETLQEISELIEKDEFDLAYDLLAPLERKYPANDEIWEERAHFYTSLGNTSEAWWSAYRALQLNRDNMQVLTNMIYLSAGLKLPWATLYYIDLYKQNSVILPPRLIELDDNFGELAQELQQQHPEMRGKKLADLALIDIARQLAGYSQLDEAMKVCRRALKIFPNLEHVRQTMPILLMFQGKLDKAINYVQETIELLPDNPTILYLLSQFQYLIGDVEVAEKVYQDLMSHSPKDLSEYMQRILLQAVLDKADDILSTYQACLSDNPELDLPPGILHYVATAMAFTGDIEGAKKLWKEIQDDAPSIASENLRDLDLPVSQQNGIAYFELNFLIPPTWIDLLSQSVRSNAQIKRRIDKLFKDAPWFENLIHILLQRGDAESREFALFVCSHHPFPILHEFATGTKGTDAHRLTALRILIKYERVSIDDLPEIMMSGKLQTPELFKYKISYESTPDDFPKHIQRMVQQCYDLLHAGEWYDAIDIIDEVRALLPDNRVLMNFEIMALKGMGEDEEAEETLAEIVEKYPDYLFARTDKARSLIQQKQYDEAQQWIEPIESRTEFHYSELRAYAVTKVEWFIAHGEDDTARNWLHQLEALFPDLSDDLQVYHKKLSVNRILSTPLISRLFKK